MKKRNNEGTATGSLGIKLHQSASFCPFPGVFLPLFQIAGTAGDNNMVDR